jgi:hypothetical protein
LVTPLRLDKVTGFKIKANFDSLINPSGDVTSYQRPNASYQRGRANYSGNLNRFASRPPLHTFVRRGLLGIITQSGVSTIIVTFLSIDAASSPILYAFLAQRADGQYPHQDLS